ncbi:pectin lyase fold/virulence factor [Aspergillus stella-maris]|uniref:pectin lyase fold/virulence factor n=1 Tax=Aspergillus stella-maris TaxID=1810926 RepID=UPI003CCD3347
MRSPTFLTILSLAAAALSIPSSPSPSSHQKTCTVHPIGSKQDDVPNILSAFTSCNHGGKVIFPESSTYWIASRLNPRIYDVDIEWRGTWLFSDDLTYWRNNSYPIEFQNHAAGFILSGAGIRIDGHGTGSINGNGDLWYMDEAGTTRPGRPMPFVLCNISETRVSNFAVEQPQLWSINIMNGTNMAFENITVSVNATQAPEGENWAQNTDGFDTMDAHSITLKNFTFTGGDDCIAIKPRSYNIHASDITCNGGNGIAIGSLGQYLEDSSVENILMENAKTLSTKFGTYIKTWMGHLVDQGDSYESAGEPRGGGWGGVRNITFRDFDVTGSNRAVVITQDNGDDEEGNFEGTSLMEVSDVRFEEYKGVLETKNELTVSCSRVHPCFGIEFVDWEVTGVDGEETIGDCRWVAEGGVQGLEGC